MTQRRDMQPGDWFNAVAFLVVGIFLGIAVEGLLRLVHSGAWLLAVAVVLPFVGLLLFENLLNKLFEKIFPTGIRPARNPKPKTRGPLIRLLSFPVGLLAGALLARLGLGTTILSMLP